MIRFWVVTIVRSVWRLIFDMRGLLLFQGVSEIERKMEEAPDSSYEIGVVIGTYLPFIVLVAVAYLLYYYSKKRRE